MRSRRYYKKISKAGRKAARARWDRENARIEAEMPDRLRGKVPESMESGQDYGEKWPESLARYDPTT